MSIGYYQLLPGDEIVIRRRGRFTAHALVAGWSRDSKTVKARVRSRVGMPYSDAAVPVPFEKFVSVFSAVSRHEAAD
ncbi:hypothetical protein [Parvibaculum sp.]|uniref:hypothetical protein n=1 Tax=Parvibaculum sp. TaxID=2024848 RepID=UPI00260E15C7|nr:hypothetical protein [Parvibaculum sp.]MCW5728142.1 hypothetical protein [Parvibaculum sp.]